LKGEAVVAFVILEGHYQPSDALKQELLEHVVREIGAIARPSELRFTESLPKTRSGKIMRRLLRALAAGEAPSGDISTLEDQSESQQTVKAILEMNLLTEAERTLAVEICLDAGVHYLKTGTGWCGGVTTEQVQWLHKITQQRVGIKAAGGIKTLAQAQELLLAGATRIGTSRGVDLVQQQAALDG
jgi:hypothetical protein